MVLNPHSLESRGAEITLDATNHPPGSTVTYLYRSDWSDEALRHPPTAQTVKIKQYDDGRATIYLELPPSGMAILS